MNYGYPPTNKDAELAERILTALEDFPEDAHGNRPYVEVNQMYRGVRIRRLTHYDHKTLECIVNACDRIHKEITER